MKNTRILLTLLLVAVIVFSLCACANTRSGSSDTADKTTASSGKRVITDVLGRKVEIPAVVNRVDCQSSSARMMVYAGAAEKIVSLTDLERGVGGSANEKTLTIMPYANKYHDLFSGLESTSSGWPKFETYTEKIITVAPDVILQFGVDATTCDKLQTQVNIPVIGLNATNFMSDDFFATLKLLGDVMGTQEHVNKVISGIKGYIEDLDKRTKDIPDDKKPSVYVGAVSFKGYNGFGGTYDEFPPFLAVHAKNVVDQIGQPGAMLLDLEKVSVWDPNIVFLNTEGIFLVNENYSTNPKFYNGLSAVKNGQVYSMAPFNCYYTNMEIALIDAYWAGKIMYPEQFKDVDIAVLADKVFNLMIDSNYYNVLDKAGHGFHTVTIGK